MCAQGHTDWRRLVYANVVPWNSSTPIEPENRAEQSRERERENQRRYNTHNDEQMDKS